MLLLLLTAERRPVSESRAHTEEVLSTADSLGGRTQSEECVMFDGAFPQMFTCSLV